MRPSELIFCLIILISYFIDSITLTIPLFFCFVLWETGLRWQFVPVSFVSVEIFLNYFGMCLILEISFLSYYLGYGLIFNSSSLAYLFLVSLFIPILLPVPILPKPKKHSVGINTSLSQNFIVVYPSQESKTKYGSSFPLQMIFSYFFLERNFITGLAKMNIQNSYKMQLQLIIYHDGFLKT